MGRDWTKPFTEKDLEELRTVFRSMPTYNEEGWIRSDDVWALCEGMEYHRTNEELASYKDYWDKTFGGIISIENYVKVVDTAHNTSKWAHALADGCDKDGDGFITAAEFEHLIKMCVVNEPRMKNFPYDVFKEQIDKTDGRMKVDDCVKWIQDYLTN